MNPHRVFAKPALIIVAACIGFVAGPPIAAAQSQGPQPQDQANQPVAVPYVAGRSTVDQQNLAPPVNYGPERADSANYPPPPAPPPPPTPPSGYDRPSDERYASRDYGPGYAPPSSYGPADNGRYDDRYARDSRSDNGAPAPDQCQMVEQRAFFPDDTTQMTTVRACRNARGRWRVVPD
jgi:hypothetical protein